MSHLGNNIKKIRQLKGVKQNDLAKKLEVTQQYISKIEKSHMLSKAVLQQIADALCVTVEKITNFDAEEIA